MENLGNLGNLENLENNTLIKRRRGRPRKPKPTRIKPRPLDYWGCVLTKPGEEARAAHYVEAAGFVFYHPLMYVPRGTGLRRETLFRGYLFVRMTDSWGVLRSMRGVVRVMTAADKPARILDYEIDYLRSLEDSNGVVVPPPAFGVGARVRFAGGARFLCGRIGVVEALEAGKCTVLVSILGREVVKKVPLALVEALDK